jgi:hypothetical protein
MHQLVPVTEHVTNLVVVGRDDDLLHRHQAGAQ